MYNPSIGIPFDDFFEENQGLIWHVVHRFSSRYDKDDLFQEACMQFMRCYEKFDASLGYKFATYAVPSMFGKLQSFLSANTHIMRLSRRATEVIGFATKNDLDLDNDELIATQGGFEQSEVHKALSVFTQNVTFLDSNKHTDKEGNESNLYDYIEGTHDDISHLYVEDFLSTLNEREFLLINMYMDGQKQRSIAEELGLSQPQISRTLKMIREKAKKHLFLQEVV
jgi:RNA polymerase sporulation-specific sigma factor